MFSDQLLNQRDRTTTTEVLSANGVYHNRPKNAAVNTEIGNGAVKTGISSFLLAASSQLFDFVQAPHEHVLPDFTRARRLRLRELLAPLGAAPFATLVPPALRLYRPPHEPPASFRRRPGEDRKRNLRVSPGGTQAQLRLIARSFLIENGCRSMQSRFVKAIRSH